MWFLTSVPLAMSTRIRTPQRTVLGEREQVKSSQVEQTLRDVCFTRFGFCGFISVSFNSRGHVILSVWTMYYVKKKVKFFSLLDLCCSLAISFHRDLIGSRSRVLCCSDVAKVLDVWWFLTVPRRKIPASLSDIVVFRYDSGFQV